MHIFFAYHETKLESFCFENLIAHEKQLDVCMGLREYFYLNVCPLFLPISKGGAIGPEQETTTTRKKKLA